MFHSPNKKKTSLNELERDEDGGKKQRNHRPLFFTKQKKHIQKQKKAYKKGPNRVRTGDLLICSQMLYHWAMDPFLKSFQLKLLLLLLFYNYFGWWISTYFKEKHISIFKEYVYRDGGWAEIEIVGSEASCD